jgi:hypothetical protein
MSGVKRPFHHLLLILAAAGVGCQPEADDAPDFNAPASPGSNNPNSPNNPNNPNNPNTPGETVPRSTDTGVTPPGTPLADCVTPGPQLLRRLTASQYRNTLTSIFGDGVPDQGVLTDTANNGFHIDADALVIGDLDSELLMGNAEMIANWARTNGRLSRYTNNCTDANNPECRRGFIRNLGRKAYREDLSDTQVSAYDALFQQFSNGNFDDGAETVAIAMLQSPNTLYRRELGTGSGGQFSLKPYEVASQLSYLLTDGPPDDQLLDAAKNNALSSRDQLDAQANRLLATEAGKRTLEQFIEGWVEIDGLLQKAKAENPALTPQVREAMGEETRQLFVDAFDTGGGVEELFTANYTFVNQALATFYGMSGGAGDAFQKVSLPPNRPPGILGHASYLTAHAQPENSSPVQRAFIIRERILCQDLPPVPQNLNTNLDPPGAFTTNRERYTEHSSNAVCYTCHQRMDPIGFAFENYDGFGRYRDQENGVPIDSSGSLSDVPGGPIPLDGVESLSNYLATSELVQSCMVRYWTYYAYGRDTWKDKQCNHDAVRREAAADSFSLKSVLMGIIHAQHFSQRVQEN